MEDRIRLTPIGRVVSSLKKLEDCPKQGREGAPPARIEIFPQFRPAMADIGVGHELIILTWFHRGHRNTLKVHPRGNPGNPLTGVFSTRSPDRPNPIGHHLVQVVAVDGTDLVVTPMEALDETPVIDIKIGLKDGPLNT